MLPCLEAVICVSVSRQLAGTRLYQEKSVEKHKERGTVSEGARRQVKTDVCVESQNTRKERLLARKRLFIKKTQIISGH